MKRILLSTLCCMTLSLSAINYCATGSWGNAGTNVTGGGNVTPTYVTNESELATALNKKNSVIIITQNITVTNHISTDKSNLTIMALPGVKLISEDQTKANSGILYLKGNNLLLRNLTFEGPGAYDCDGWDLLCLDKATNVWVDHCDFQDGCDGNFDIKSLSDNITVTWCRFRYLKEPRAGGKETDDHRFSNLIGSGNTDMPSDGTYNITYAFCWWDEGCKQRMTRCRNCELHFLNCYWNSSVADYYVGPENAKCYFEGCTFAGKANSARGIWSPFNGTTNYCTFVNCTGNLPSNSTKAVAAPTYAYDQLSAATAKNYVTNSSCGAGATLTVTTNAEVSSSCDSEEEKPDPVVISGDCCIDLSLGEMPTTANGGIPSDFRNVSVSANMTKSTWDQGFLNMGGNADYITFDFSAYNATIGSVSFDVTIPNLDAAQNKNTIAYHWNSESNTLYTISSKNTETVTLTAPANAKSLTIQRSAGTSTRISQVCFTLQAGTATQTPTQETGAGVRKIIYNNKVYILRDGQLYLIDNGMVYDVRGQRR
jgi:pectate lyase